MIPTREDIIRAHASILPWIHETPVQTCSSIDQLAQGKLYFKCENFQKVGAFKARGAMNAVLALGELERLQGVATHSSGNHGQALARAANLLRVKSYIVMPSNSAEIKKNGVKIHGGEIIECEPTLAARERTLAAVIMKTKATEIHPFNNDRVISGQATAAKELLEAVPKIDAIVAPVGGGGLLSGTALAASYFSRGVDVYGAEPEGADDAHRAMRSGKIEKSQSNSIADGLLTSLGTKTFPIIREHVKKIITVSDEEIVSAMRLIWERMKMIVEPSAAVPLAAVLKNPETFEGRNVGLIITGGNVDLTRAADLMLSK